MDDVLERLLEISRKGYFCAQMMLMLALEGEGKEDPDLIRAMGGLSEGLGGCGGICGALSGGMCFLNYYAGKGEDDEIEHIQLKSMSRELMDWFTEYTAEYGGVDCIAILAGDERNKIQRCPMIVRDTLEKCMSLLEENDAL